MGDTTAPSVKGSGFASVLQDVQRLIDEGRITPEMLEARFEAEDLAYLDQKVSSSNWYPVGSYERALELVCDAEGGSDRDAYFHRRGAMAADRLRETGLYPMLDADCERLGLRALRLFITIAEALYNFTKWRGEVDEENRRFTVHVDEAGDYPEVARKVAAGFLEHGAARVTRVPVVVTSERAAPDRVIFHFRIGERAS